MKNGMEETVDLRKLALVDPIAAYGFLVGMRRLPVSINVTGTFPTNTVGLQVEGSFDTQIDTRTWIRNIAFTLDQPSSFAASIFQAQFLKFLKEVSGVSARIEVASGPRYIEALHLTPLENLVNIFDNDWPNGWCIQKLQTVGVTFQLTRAQPSVPYNVVLTFNGWQFGDPQIDDISLSHAIACLRKAGIDVPEQCCSRAMPLPLVG